MPVSEYRFPFLTLSKTRSLTTTTTKKLHRFEDIRTKHQIECIIFQIYDLVKITRYPKDAIKNIFNFGEKKFRIYDSMLDALSAKRKRVFSFLSEYQYDECRRTFYIAIDLLEFFFPFIFGWCKTVRIDQMEFMVHDLSVVWMLELILEIWVFGNSRHAFYLL